MRPTPVRVALTGSSQVGKTTTAKLLGALLSGTVRHCGDALRDEAARQLLRPPYPARLHRRIDSETRLWVLAGATARIVEGRFLQKVLATVPDVLIVRLVCAFDERVRRRAGVPESARAEAHLIQSDSEDKAKMILLYGSTSATPDCHLEIDTSAIAPLAVAATITKRLTDGT